MKIRYTGDGTAGKEPNSFVLYEGDLIPQKVYDVIAVERDDMFYRIIDESGEDYLYFKGLFEVVVQNDEDEV